MVSGPLLIGSSVSHASSLCCLPHFRCCIPSWLSKLLTHSDFSSPPDAETTACLPLSPPAPTAVQIVIFITNLYFCITHSSSAPLITSKVLQPFPPGSLITWLPQRNLFLVIGQSHHQSRIGEPLTPFLFPLPHSLVLFLEAGAKSDLTCSETQCKIPWSYSRLYLPMQSWTELSFAVTAFGGCGAPPPLCGCSQMSLVHMILCRELGLGLVTVRPGGVAYSECCVPRGSEDWCLHPGVLKSKISPLGSHFFGLVFLMSLKWHTFLIKGSSAEYSGNNMVSGIISYQILSSLPFKTAVRLQ